MIYRDTIIDTISVKAIISSDYNILECVNWRQSVLGLPSGGACLELVRRLLPQFIYVKPF